MQDSPNNPFLGGLKARPKSADPTDIAELDRVAERRGFVDRAPRKKPGRKPSPRSFQLHPKVMPAVGEAFALEAEQLGITQGHLLEMAWKAYVAKKEG